MTAEGLKALGLRAMACAGWRWLPRMAVDNDPQPGCVLRAEDDDPSGRSYLWIAWNMQSEPKEYSSADPAWATLIPDLSDSATVGRLQELVREAWGDRTLCTRFDGLIWKGEHRWLVQSTSRNVTIQVGGKAGVSEAEALVIALERAP